MKSIEEILGMGEIEWHKQCRKGLSTEKIGSLAGQLIEVRDKNFSNIFTYSNDLAYNFYVKHPNNTIVHCADVIRQFDIANEEFDLFEVDNEHCFLDDVPLFFGVNGFYLISKRSFRFFYLGTDENTDIIKIPFIVKKYLLKDRDYNFYSDFGKDRNVFDDTEKFRLDITNFLNQWNLELLGDYYRKIKILNEFSNNGFTVRFFYVDKKNNLYTNKILNRTNYYLYTVDGFYIEVLENGSGPIFQYYYGNDLGKATSIYNSTVKSFK